VWSRVAASCQQLTLEPAGNGWKETPTWGKYVLYRAKTDGGCEAARFIAINGSEIV